MHDPDETYYLVAANISVPYWKTTELGLQDAAKEMGVQAKMVGPDSYDPSGEKDYFQIALNHHASGILVSPADAKILSPMIDQAISQGIPVITIDSDAVESKRLLFIGTNNYQAGMLGGRTVARLLNGKGNVEIYTIPGQANLDERLRGYREALSGHPGIKVVEVFDMHGDAGAAFDKTYQLIGPQAKTRIDAFACLEAISGAEVAKVLENKNIKDRVIVAMDTQPETIQFIQKGTIAATIAQKPFTMAAFGVRLLDSLHHSKLPLDRNWSQSAFSPVPAFVDTGTTLVDRSNVQAFNQPPPGTSASGSGQ
jgi:ribose transport system substrate-binding protein